MRVRPARSDDLPSVCRLAAELVRQHHRLDPERFMLVEPIEDGYRWFFTKELKRKHAIILVAETEGGEPDALAAGAKKPRPVARDRDAASEFRIVGYAYATLESRNWNDLLDTCGKLNDVYVDPSARRAGAGRALVTEILSALRERGAPRVVLLSAWRNPDAHAFFEALGFRRTMLEMTRES